MRHTVAAMLTGFLIGVYDGALGPGTGSFLVFALVGLMGYAFLEASAKAKIANVATNLGALAVFAPGGHVIWPVGPRHGRSANLVGRLPRGAHRGRLGSRFVRVVFVVVVTGVRRPAVAAAARHLALSAGRADSRARPSPAAVARPSAWGERSSCEVVGEGAGLQVRPGGREGASPRRGTRWWAVGGATAAGLPGRVSAPLRADDGTSSLGAWDQ